MQIENAVQESSNRSDVGKALRRLRLGLEWSQAEVAEKANLSRSAVNSLENGHYRNMTLQSLQAVAESLGTSLGKILARSEAPEPFPIKKGSETRGEFVLDYPEAGFRIVSWLPRRKEFFLGNFSLNTKCEISNGILPRAELLFFETLSGIMLVSFGARDVVLKEGEYLFFDGREEYRLYNPDPMRQARGLLTSFPSFL